jgi:hypothetical protein
VPALPPAPCFPPAANAWTGLAPMPDPAYSALAVYGDGRLFVLGGTDGTVTLDNNRIYSVVSDTWTLAAPLPAALQQMSGGYFSGKLYVIGGQTGSNPNTAQPATWEYDVAANTWTPRTPLPVALAGAGSAVMNGHVFVAGGHNAVLPASSTVLDYDIAGDAWTVLAGGMFVARDGPALVAIDHRLVVFGGRNSSGVPLNATDIYNLGNRRWMQGPLQTVARAYQGGATAGRYLVGAGGYDGANAVNVTEAALDTCSEQLLPEVLHNAGSLRAPATPTPGGK